MLSGIKIGIVTSRSSSALRYRCKNLEIPYLFDGVEDKAAFLDEIVEKSGIPSEKIAFMGDDLQDIALMRKVGVSIAVSDACPEAIEIADLITEAKGGQGAVREASEAILKSQGKWQGIIDRFLS
jgi:3-deoxy-D-manno-octulosonate 8-phosphate phosphatase (KDO 8-P phosphatase)